MIYRGNFMWHHKKFYFDDLTNIENALKLCNNLFKYYQHRYAEPLSIQSDDLIQEGMLAWIKATKALEESFRAASISKDNTPLQVILKLQPPRRIRSINIWIGNRIRNAMWRGLSRLPSVLMFSYGGGLDYDTLQATVNDIEATFGDENEHQHSRTRS